MKKQEIIEELCKLADKVATDVFGNKKSADCFCESFDATSFSFEKEVFEFIRDAVEDKIADRTDYEDSVCDLDID